MIEAALQELPREKIATGLKSFYYDNAISSGAQTMGALSHVTSNDHIMFGSDWPFCDHRIVSEEVAQLTAPAFLTADTVTMIKRKNALKLFPMRAAQFS
jgi:6-methylsalicylate decarboxylase